LGVTSGNQNIEQPGVLIRWTGSSWEPLASVPGWTDMQTQSPVWGTSGCLYVWNYGGLFRWNGEFWETWSDQRFDENDGVQFITGFSCDDVYVLPFQRQIRHWDGREWSEIPEHPHGEHDYLKQIWAAPDGAVYATGGSGLYSWNGEEWSSDQVGDTSFWSVGGYRTPSGIDLMLGELLGGSRVRIDGIWHRWGCPDDVAQCVIKGFRGANRDTLLASSGEGLLRIGEGGWTHVPNLWGFEMLQSGAFGLWQTEDDALFLLVQMWDRPPAPSLGMTARILP
jgi:hypothetical protein